MLVSLVALAFGRLANHLTAEPDYAAIEANYIERKRASMLEGAKRRQARWDERCETIDCNQLPVGFSTLEIGEDRYYFPLRHVAQQTVPETGLHAGLGYFSSTHMSDFDDQWQIERSFTSSDWTVFGRGYTELFDWFGLRDTEDSRFIPMSGFMFVSGGADQWRDEKHLYEHLETVVSPELLEDDLIRAIATVSEPFSADFVRIANYSTFGGGYAIVSKEPVHRERHIVGRCRRGSMCDFFTLRQRGADEMRNPIFNLRQVVVLPRQELYNCDGYRDGFVTPLCPDGEAYFGQIDDLFTMVDQMFEAAAVFPEAR